MKYGLFLLAALIPGCPFSFEAEEQADKEEIALLVEEAEATIKVYEARLQSVRAQLAEDELQRDHADHHAKRLENLFRNNAVAEKDYFASQREYEIARIRVTQSLSEVQEAEQDIVLAKVRKKMAERGSVSEPVKIDRFTIRRQRSD